MMNLKGNIDKKVEGLLSQMTLEEKVAQMQQLSANATPAEIFKDLVTPCLQVILNFPMKGRYIWNMKPPYSKCSHPTSVFA